MQRPSDTQLSFSMLVGLMRRSRAVFGRPKPQHFHFARILRGDTLASSLARHEHYLNAFLNLKPGMQVLELGCGTGGAALELANFANVTVLGVDDDPAKICAATSAAQNAHVSRRVTFMTADLHHLGEVLPAESFDCVYAIEALKVHSTFETSFCEIRRLLKPGGKFALYEWCWTSAFDETDPDHCRLAELVEDTTQVGHRAPSERCIEAAISAIHCSGLQLLHREDLAARRDETPWYFPLEAAISDPRITWQPGPNAFGMLSKTGATVLVEAGKRKLFTPMALFVGQRPHN